MTNWLLAACQGVNPEVFFHPNPNRALAICHTCPIEPGCLDTTLTLEAQGPTVVHGVAGGKTEDERRAIASRRLGGTP